MVTSPSNEKTDDYLDDRQEPVCFVWVGRNPQVPKTSTYVYTRSVIGEERAQTPFRSAVYLKRLGSRSTDDCGGEPDRTVQRRVPGRVLPFTFTVQRGIRLSER